MTAPFLPGQTLTAGRLEILRRPPSASVFNSVAQNVPNATTTVMAADSQNFDTDDMHDPVVNNSRLTVHTEGQYMFVCAVGIAAGTGVASTQFRVSGALIPGGNEGTITSLFGVNLVLTRILPVTVGDWVEVVTFHTEGSTHPVTLNEFSALRLSGL